jgi:gliding motility-associated-like protein
MSRKLVSTSAILVICCLSIANTFAHKASNGCYNSIFLPNYTTSETKNVVAVSASDFTKQKSSNFTSQFDLGANTTNNLGILLGDNRIKVKSMSDKALTKTSKSTIGKAGLSYSATLKSLSLSAGLITPVFSSNSYSYSVLEQSTTGSITVTPTLTDPLAMVTVNNNLVTTGTASPSISLAFGNSNVITIVVTAQDGTKLTYTLTVNRPYSTVATLSSLTLSTGTLSPTFATAITAYSVNESNSTTSIKVTPFLSDANATIAAVTADNGAGVTAPVVIGGAYTIALTNVGQTLVTIQITAQDGKTQQFYTIAVNRSVLSSSNASLSGLSVSSGSLNPGFSGSTFYYTNYLPASTTSIILGPTTSDSQASMVVTANNNATVTPNGGNYTIASIGASGTTVAITVTAPDGYTKQTYTLLLYPASTSASAYLGNLIANNGALSLSPGFSSGTFIYNANITYSTNTITISPTTLDPGATVAVTADTWLTVTPNGNAAIYTINNLLEGINSITITVTSQDKNSTKAYTLKVNKAGSTTATLSSLAVTGFSISPTFIYSTTNYALTVPNATSSITLTHSLADANATAVLTANGQIITPSVSNNTYTYSINNLSFNGNTITILVTAPDTKTQQTYTLTVTRTPLKINTLSNLIINDGSVDLSPVFKTGILNYTFTVSNSTTTITVTPTGSDASESITVNNAAALSGSPNSISLNVGLNIINTVVTAQDGTTKQTYAINVTRTPLTIATLSNLVVSGNSLDKIFNSTTFNYSVNVLNGTNNIILTPTSSDASETVSVIDNGSTITSINGNYSVPLNIGSNTIQIVATAQDGTTHNTYTITASRAKSSVASLSALIVNTGSLNSAFDSGTLFYSESVPYETTSITVTPILSDPSAILVVTSSSQTIKANSGNYTANLPAVGSNVITMAVTAQDGTLQTYTLTVNRAASLAASLISLTVNTGNLNPGFSTTNYTYTDNVNNATNSITIEPTLANSNSQISVSVGSTSYSVSAQNDYTIPLAVNGNVITILITPQDGTSPQTYTLTVNRAPLASAALSDLSVNSGTFSPTFSISTLNYIDNVVNATDSITVTATLNDTSSRISVNAGNKTMAVTSGVGFKVPISLGSNIISMLVKSKDNINQQTYYLTVNRPKSSVNTLSSLAIDGGTSLIPGFNSADTVYTYKVANSTTLVKITPALTDSTGTISLSLNGVILKPTAAKYSVPLAVGDNPVMIKVIAQDGTTKNYAIKINRASSALTTLDSLKISGNGVLSPNSFSSNNANYIYNVTNITGSITITPKLTDTNATVTVNGKAVASRQPSQLITLPVGKDTIPIVVTGQDGISTQTYMVTVIRAPSTDATLSNLGVTNGNLTPLFSADNLNYFDNVQSSIKLIGIAPILSDLNAKVKVTVGGNLSVNPNGSIYLVDNLTTGNNNITITVTAQDGITQQIYNITIKQAPPGTNTLSDLSVSNGTLNPAFDSEVYAYTETVPNSTGFISLTPTTNDNHAQVSLNGNTVISGLTTSPTRLNLGLNTFNLKVTAQDSSTKTYVLTVNRIPSRIATLDNIIINGVALTPGFDSGDTSYTANVSNAVSNVLVTPIVTDQYSSVTVNGLPVIPGSTQNIALNAVGYTNITTVVTAQDGVTQQTYNLLVNRAPAGDSILYSLLVSKGRIAPVFESDTSNYVDNVTNNTKSITITPKANNPNATISINGTQLTSTNSNYDGTLTVGNNNFNIVVTAPNLSTKQYNLKVNRAPLGSALLGSLFLTCLPKDTSFKSTTLSYTYNVPNNITSTRLLITPNDSTSDMYIVRQNTTNALPELVDSGRLSQPILLSAGTNTVKILVTAQNGTTLTYTLTIIRAQSPDNALSNLTISGASAFKFDTAKYSYDNIYLDNDTYTYVSVTPTEHDINTTASITVNGQAILSGNPTNPIPIIPGVNKITIVVTAQNGNARTYTVLLYKRPLLTDLAILDMHNVNISNKSLNPAFYTTTYSYIDTVSSSNINIYVSPTFNGCTALVNGKSVTSGNQSQAIPLTPGYNKISVMLTSLDGATTNTYNVSTYRPASNNDLLSNLTISSGSITPAFDTNTTGYTTTVNYDINSITVTPTAVGPNASITVNNTSISSGSTSGSIPLLVGPNTITTKVIAEDGITINNYSIIIIRNPQSQTFTFDPLMAVNYGDPDLTLNATVSSKQPIKYTSSNPTIATIDTLTNTVHFIGVGTVTITAKVKSNNQYFPVDSISRQLVINKGNQTIENTQIPVFIKGDQYDLSKIFNASSKLPISSFIVLNHELDSIKSSNYIPLQLGTDSIIVIQNGNSLYNATRKSFEITISDAANNEIVTHQFVTPNGDGINDYLVIEGIQLLNNNNVKIINRSGVVVYSAKGYDNEKVKFDGHSSDSSAYLPSGTYFYIIDYTNAAGASRQKTGFFLLKF